MTISEGSAPVRPNHATGNAEHYHALSPGVRALKTGAGCDCHSLPARRGLGILGDVDHYAVAASHPFRKKRASACPAAIAS